MPNQNPISSDEFLQAVQDGHSQTVKQFLEENAGEIDDEIQQNAFMDAVGGNHLETLELLLTHFDSQLPQELKGIALRVAVNMAMPKILNALLEHCSDLRHEDINTAFVDTAEKDYMPASKSDAVEMIKIFIKQYGNEITAESKKQAFQSAIDLSNQEMLTVLIEKCSNDIFASKNQLASSVEQESEMKFGPSNKNLSTQSLELLVKIILKDPASVTFHVDQNKIYANLDGQTIDFSTMLYKADLSHLKLSSKDVNSDFFPISDNVKNLSNDEKYNKKETSRNLSNEELEAIFQYTLAGDIPGCYTKVNDILYGKIEEDVDPEELKKTITSLCYLTSGLNKLLPGYIKKENEKTYRGEAYTQASEVSRRKYMVDNPSKGNISTKPAFQSTSTDKAIGRKFTGESMLVFDENHGKQLKATRYKEEKEYLLMPTKMLWKSYKIKKNKETGKKFVQFSVQPITPLNKEKEKLTSEELINFNILKNAANSKEIDTHALNIVRELDNDLIKASQYVYDKHLVNAYTNRSYTADWSLDTPLGVVNRPNHGLAHTLRVTAMIPVVAQFLKVDMAKEDLKLLQLASLFAVTGRENDGGFSDNKTLYESFRKKSAENFKIYAESINMDPASIQKGYDLVLNMGKPDKTSDDFTILNVTHKLDLIRCYNDKQLQNSIINPLLSKMSKENCDRLMDHALDMIVETGDSVVSYKHEEPKEQDKTKFYQMSTNVKSCWDEILSIPPPSPILIAKSKETPPKKSKIQEESHKHRKEHKPKHKEMLPSFKKAVATKTLPASNKEDLPKSANIRKLEKSKKQNKIKGA
jgi:hypothetical protein